MTPAPATSRRGGADRAVPTSTRGLLARSEAELVAATLASDPDERFLHAHLAAVRAGAALLAVTGRPSRRGLRTVWDMVAAVAPELAGWTALFADNASARSAIEAGRTGVVDDARADRAGDAAEAFHEAVRARIGLTPSQPSLVRTAS